MSPRFMSGNKGGMNFLSRRIVPVTYNPFCLIFFTSKGLAKKLSQKIAQFVFCKDLQNSITTDSPKLCSTNSFFPRYKSNWCKYPFLLSARHHHLKPHFIGLFFRYWRAECLPLNFVICSSMA